MLRDRVENFIASGGGHLNELRSLLTECVADGTLEGLTSARRLYESDYGDYFWRDELKAHAAAALVVWGEAGIQALLDGARPNSTRNNIFLCMQLLSSIAGGSAFPPLDLGINDELLEKIKTSWSTAPQLSDFCRTCLVELVLSIEKDEVVALYMSVSSTKAMFDISAARELFAAFSTRWLAVSKPVLERYAALITEQPDSEPAFQGFLTEHAQLLDPMAVQVWPKPNLFGFLIPDFVVRRADDSYVIVEIETPGKVLVTVGGHLSAQVTHAEQQAREYRSYMMKHSADACLHFPNFDDPECLVVIGLERSLDPRKMAVLKLANHDHPRLRIVGFDWLADRAHAVATNVVRRHGQVVEVRMT